MTHASSSRGRSTHTRSRRRALAALAVALALGGLTGLGGASVLAGTARGDANGLPSLDPALLIDAAHLPPLLTARGEPVTLRYDVYCTAPDGDPESGAPCDAGGTVHVRPGTTGPFTALPLRLDTAAAEGRYAAEVPRDVARDPDGFTYYAVLRNRRNGISMTLPPGGAEAPHRSLPLWDTVAVDLGAHDFGRTRAPTERVFAAPWGTGAHEVGLEDGRRTAPVGPSAFDVDRSGRVALLDQVNRRLLRLERSGSGPSPVALPVGGALADLTLDEEGTIYVLESTGDRPGERPLLRTFDRAGRPLGASEVAERTAAQVRLGPRGPVVKHLPSELWLPAARSPAGAARLSAQSPGTTARPTPQGAGVTVLNRGDELRLSLTAPGRGRRSWLVRSGTPLGEVQLADPLGSSRLVVVVRAYTEERDEFAVLVLGPRGLEGRFAVSADDWAETAPLSRFRLAGASLYRLGSTPAGAHVDRFALEVTD